MGKTGIRRRIKVRVELKQLFALNFAFSGGGGENGVEKRRGVKEGERNSMGLLSVHQTQDFGYLQIPVTVPGQIWVGTASGIYPPQPSPSQPS